MYMDAAKISGFPVCCRQPKICHAAKCRTDHALPRDIDFREQEPKLVNMPVADRGFEPMLAGHANCCGIMKMTSQCFPRITCTRLVTPE